MVKRNNFYSSADLPQVNFRKQLVALHKETYRRNELAINASVTGYNDSFKRYRRAYRKGIKHYQRRASLKQLDRAMGKADVIFVGDYHTLPQAQRAFLRLLRRLPADRPVTIALEFVEGRFQSILDQFMADTIDVDTFHQGIHYSEHWLFGEWSGFRDILAYAKLRNYRAIAIDTHRSGAHSLRQRDDYAAKKIAKNHIKANTTHATKRHGKTALQDKSTAKQNNGQKIHSRSPLTMVLVGDLHIAPAHLPHKVAKELTKQGATARPLTLYQNCPDIYWQLETLGHEHDTELVQIDNTHFCIINTPPVVCQQSFLTWLQADDALMLDACEQNFFRFVDDIAQFFALPVAITEEARDVEVATTLDLSFLQRLQRRGDFNDRDINKIQQQIISSESYFIPRAKMVYLGTLSVNHMAEEATHLLRDLCCPEHEPKSLVDAFYARTLEEAIAWVGSKVINPKRKCSHQKTLKSIQRNPQSSALDKETARLALKHIRFEERQKVHHIAAIYNCNAELFNAVTHTLGYILGDKLYYALIGTGGTNTLTKTKTVQDNTIIDTTVIHDLFYTSFAEPREALTSYFYLSLLVNDTPLPIRM